MKKIGKFAVAIALLAAISLPVPACRSSAKPILNVFAWAGLFKPALIARFEQEAGCKVVITTVESNETVYADLSNEVAACDLLTAPSSLVGLMAAQEMLQPLDHELLPNLEHVDPEFLSIALDKTMEHSVPHVVANTGLAYLKSRVKDFLPTWGMLDRPDLKGRIVVLDDMRQTIGAALKSLGYSLNSTDPLELAKARDVVLRWKKNQARFENGQVPADLAAGRAFLVHGFSNEVLPVQAGNSDIAYAMPFEGGAVDCVDLVIPKNSAQTELAHALINFFHDPVVAAENSLFIGYLCPNKDSYAYFDEDLRTNPAVFLPPTVLSKCEVVADLGAANELWVKVWNEIKAAK